ncbi:MAG: SRPBCC domain-containing protein [Bacteroidia bacterium]
MKNFNWTSFSRKIAVKATLTQMYDAWAKPSEIEKWFLSNADYFDSDKKPFDKNTNIEKGLTYAWNWFTYDITENGTITEANGKDFLQFTFAGNCLVDIKLTEQDDHTIVELTQKNIPEDDESKQNIRLGCDTGWSFYLVNLKSVYEGGLDLRNKHPNFKPMVNS